MKKFYLLSMVIGLSCAGYQADGGQSSFYASPRPASDYASDFSGELSAGYSSRYTYKNIAVAPLLNRSGDFSIAGNATMPLTPSLKQHFGARYFEILDGALDDRNEFNAFWSADKEIFPNLTAGAGYELTYGGLPGYVAKRMGKAPHSLTQGVNAYLRYDDPGHGYFGTVNLQYGFYGLMGWRLDLEGGKRWKSNFSQNVDFELSAGMGFSTSYWGSGIDGMDQANVKFAMPIRTNLMDDRKGFKIVPFIQAVIGGNTRSQIRDYCGQRIIDRFQILGGVSVIYNF